MRLIAPMLFFLIGAGAGALVSALFGRRGCGIGRGALIGLIGGIAALFLKDALDIDLGEVLLGSLTAVLTGGFVLSLIANLIAFVFAQAGTTNRHDKDSR